MSASRYIAKGSKKTREMDRAPPPALARVLQPAGRAAAGAAEATILAGEESIAGTASEAARRPARASE